MAIIFNDPFDSYANVADASAAWSISGTDSHILFDTVGRNGTGKCMRFVDNLGVYQHALRGYAPRATIFCEFNLKIVGSPKSNAVKIVTLWNDGTYQMSLVMAATSGLVYFTKNETTNLGASASAGRAFRPGVDYWVEIKYTMSNSISANDCILTVNGEEWINIDAGVDTSQNVNQTTNGISLGPIAGSSNDAREMLFDDFVLLDGTGSAPYNSTLGNHRCDVLRAIGTGATNQWVGSDADSVDNHLHVDEVTPDGDTTYNESATPGEIELYPVGALPVTAVEILAVNATSVARKTDSGARISRSMVRTGAANFEGPDHYLSDNNYLRADGIFELNPDTGVAWTPAEIAVPVQVGIKVQS